MERGEIGRRITRRRTASTQVAELKKREGSCGKGEMKLEKKAQHKNYKKNQVFHLSQLSMPENELAGAGK